MSTIVMWGRIYQRRGRAQGNNGATEAAGSGAHGAAPAPTSG